MENIFEQVSAMKPQTEPQAKPQTFHPEEKAEPQENKTEIEMMAHTTISDEEREQKEAEAEKKRQTKNRHIFLKSVS